MWPGGMHFGLHSCSARAAQLWTTADFGCVLCPVLAFCDGSEFSWNHLASFLSWSATENEKTCLLSIHFSTLTLNSPTPKGNPLQ